MVSDRISSPVSSGRLTTEIQNTRNKQKQYSLSVPSIYFVVMK